MLRIHALEHRFQLFGTGPLQVPQIFPGSGPVPVPGASLFRIISDN